MRTQYDKAGEKKKEGEVGCGCNTKAEIPMTNTTKSQVNPNFQIPKRVNKGVMRKERTFLMIKPEGVERGLIGEIIGRFERNGFKIIALKLSKISRELAEKQYEEHRGKDFFDDLVSYMSSAPTVSMMIEGENAIAVAREMAGVTDPKLAKPGTIRGDYGIDVQRNIIHASDSEKSAKREISIHFENLNF